MVPGQPGEWVNSVKHAELILIPLPQEKEHRFWISIDLEEQILMFMSGGSQVCHPDISGMGHLHKPGLFQIYSKLSLETKRLRRTVSDFYYLEDVP